jgi:hypothetical protein
MRNATCCLLVVLFGSWSSSLGQNAPKFTTPQIVATFQRLGQTAEIPPTTIYTPKNWATFRVSIVMVETVGTGNQATWAGRIQFTDGAGENSGIPFEAQLDVFSRTTAVAEFPIRAKAGKPLIFSVVPDGGDQRGSKYNVWVVVEQLM